MTVSELIERLRELPLDAIVMVRDSEGELSRVDDADLMPYANWMRDTRRVYITGS